MLNKEEIENQELAMKIHRALDYIYSTIKENGEISQFKKDVMIIINILLEKQLNKEELTACEIAFKNQQSRIQIEKEKYIQRKIEQLEADLYEANNTINQYKEREQKLIKYLEKDITEENIRIINNSRHNGKHVKDLIELEKELIIDVLNQYRRETLERLKEEKNE